MSQVITMYSTGPTCPQCNLTERRLTAKGVTFEVVDLTTNPAAMAYVTEDLGYSQAPVVVVDEHDHWSGFQPGEIDRIAVALA